MRKAEKTFWARIYIAGDYGIAKHVCRDFCFDVGLCVNITRADYIYTGGEETGIVIELINYPRFPASPKEITDCALLLADRLRDKMAQHSFSVMTPKETIWDSKREAQ